MKIENYNSSYKVSTLSVSTNKITQKNKIEENQKHQKIKKENQTTRSGIPREKPETSKRYAKPG